MAISRCDTVCVLVGSLIQQAVEKHTPRHLFHSIVGVQETTDAWLRRYEEITPHDALRSLPQARCR
jgi:hypothetical protein